MRHARKGRRHGAAVTLLACARAGDWFVTRRLALRNGTAVAQKINPKRAVSVGRWRIDELAQMQVALSLGNPDRFRNNMAEEAKCGCSGTVPAREAGMVVHGPGHDGTGSLIDAQLSPQPTASKVQIRP